MSKEAPWKLILHICCQNVLYIDLHNTWRVMCLVEESLTINLKEAINLYNIRNLHRLMTVKCSENRIHLSRRRFMEDIKSNLHSSSLSLFRNADERNLKLASFRKPNFWWWLSYSSKYFFKTTKNFGSKVCLKHWSCFTLYRRMVSSAKISNIGWWYHCTYHFCQW